MATQPNPTRDDFAALLEMTLGGADSFEGRVVKGTVTAIENDLAVIDVGLKSEGRVPLREFAMPGQKADLKVGDEVEVFVDRVENVHGEAMLSRDRARREAAWDTLETEFAKTARVEGVIFGRVKGGFTVDLNGAVAFLPGSQVDIRPVRDVTPLMDIPQPFQILKMDRKRGNIVVSRRAILEETRAEQRSGLILSLAEGQIIDGVVKNITDYGAFVDLGGIDGLLHVTDLSYKRVGHPSEVLNIGDTVKVQIIRINKDTQRISLGMKQLESDPWEGAAAKYPVGAKLTGRVTNITEYGAFVELEPGIEGLVHVSEMSWTKKNVHPGKIVSTSQEVDVVVIEVDPDKRRISLGLKQAISNPWEAFAEAHPIGSTVEGEVKNATEFGLFIGLDNDVDGMVHMSDIAWGVSGEDALNLHRKGEMVQAIVLDIDAEKERISLGMKQLERGAPAAGGVAAGGISAAASGLNKNAIVTVTVLEVRDAGLEVQVGDDGATGFIKRTDLGRDRDEQRPERFQTGQKFDAMVTGFDRSKKPTFSIKAMQISEEKQAVAQYGSSDSGASLGDILGAALKAQGADAKK
ncbi:30S ribosomal protein S1 [Sphingomonas sp. AAP5]|uniref:30S ribosomal protein S1 n=2 Tax=Sphingomonas glacialis TaxID=658225 RepID=A0A502FXK4_9SPHN|nr:MULTISPECIES: 30S ribosomal protein S1 [Sphingomonas]MDY7525613.1 30S ribosomal protein S1 [Sphingomonas sp. 10B4]MEB0282999.1 30S ribosomal protein S1 [Sphingomonas sp. 10B4]QBM75621.1 30S ribosomal protein S1 [Sphingomonas sp. AAP5]TPG54238.1 30S ribosomal protein S1 [Sphingomonas glacialis]GHH08473.1 30S ribosomal protein S1 [Sphingomonas glacialis]